MAKLGQIQDVTVDKDENEVRVDVVVSPSEFRENIRYETPGVGVWIVPNSGDIVEVKDLGPNRAVAFSPKNNPVYDMPAGLSEGDVAIKLNENTTLHFNESGGSYDITLECDGDLNIDAANIFIGENGSKVATADHTHDYDWTDGGGSSTTEPENEAPTDTEIE